MKILLKQLMFKVDGLEADKKLSGPCHCNVEDSDAIEEVLGLPLKTVAEVQQLERSLGLPPMLQKLKLVLLRRGERALSNMVYRIMEKLFSDQVCASYTWTGKTKKGERKNCFSALRRINAAIFSAVRASSRLQVEETQDDDVEFYIREWLRHSQEKCDRKRISPAAYEDPMDQ
ncbi:uncharacterized protein LOC116921870 [Daphnia magna]|nr:uncharacterized protein LOC116921870 [Daphnia magna]